MKDEENQGLYNSRFEHDACGLGFVASIDNKKTHSIIQQGLEILSNLAHRGALGGDLKTGDGAGISIQLPHKFFLANSDFDLGAEGQYGVANIFLSQEPAERELLEKLVEEESVKLGANVLAWRAVPYDESCLGSFALQAMPCVKQLFISFDNCQDQDELERKLYVLRRAFENKIYGSAFNREQFYVCSLSSRVLVYKGMFTATQLGQFYSDLHDKNMSSAYALVHQRYSTNTFPSWPLAHPYRYIAHNGEINTLQRNIKNMMVRNASLESDLFGADIEKLKPIIQKNTSDSASFDNVLELLTLSGRSIEHSIMMMIPEAFGEKHYLSAASKGFYEYHTTMMEPWDGPATVAFANGKIIGASLDRNGLRPARYTITTNGLLILASEAGVLNVAPEQILESGRLSPGKIILVDLENQRIHSDAEIKNRVVRSKPYRRWLAANHIELESLRNKNTQYKASSVRNLFNYQKFFSYSFEDLYRILLVMARDGQEPVSSMGNDAPMAVLSKRPATLYDYFRQTFAQVTNPPIDPYRESLVMSLMSYVGKTSNILAEGPENCRQLKLKSPILTDHDLDTILRNKHPELRSSRLATLVPAQKLDLDSSLQQLNKKAEDLIENGNTLLVISDRGLEIDLLAIPTILVLSSVNNHLIRVGKRHLCDLLVETADARDVHQLAVLISYGASAVNPYLAFQSIEDLYNRAFFPDSISLLEAQQNYLKACNKGLLKIMSKIGISTIRSYIGGQNFELIGMKKSFVDKYFSGTPTVIEGIALVEIEKDLYQRHQMSWDLNSAQVQSLSSGGVIHERVAEEQHNLSSAVLIQMQKATQTKDYKLFKEYSRAINDFSRSQRTLRSLFKFKKTTPVDISEVLPAREIVKRFVSSAMSLGSLSPEVHESLAVAMNSIGAASNSGEGGEDIQRLQAGKNGEDRHSRVRQVASGRFGVDSVYLAQAQELQIKIAQGAKPGEGGQLPGFKVNKDIARVRFTSPGVSLISPPPHHDIYSIEDLAQLIYDLKRSNSAARVSVKLVSKTGVGTIASGVAKAKADTVVIAGHDGGTGAAGLSSIKHAGSCWELGLAETQQTLILNGLREKIRVQCDGQMKTGRDVVIAAILGAEEFGFGTAGLVSQGCIMLRKCHTNSCPVGVATQDPELRKRFAGKPEYLVNFMMFIAEEVRELMAELGCRRFEELVGSTELLELDYTNTHYKTEGLDLSPLLYKPETQQTRYCSQKQLLDLQYSIDEELIEVCKDSLENKRKTKYCRTIRNCNRTVGTNLSFELTKRYGAAGLAADTIQLKFIGSAGQSFGAFLNSGISMELEGESNDYFGKGLSGGKLIVHPAPNVAFKEAQNIVVGNVTLFGATAGEAYISGFAGERFCVRNSGASAIVEGIGAHGCEYMTGGEVIILGPTGVNFGAGMSGGIAYVLDEDQLFDTRCNLEQVDLEMLLDPDEQELLKTKITRHLELTQSRVAQRILNNWKEYLPLFIKIIPIEYRKVLAQKG